MFADSPTPCHSQTLLWAPPRSIPFTQILTRSLALRQCGFCFSTGRELLRAFVAHKRLTPAGAAGVLCRTWITRLCCHSVLLPSLQISVAVSFAVAGASRASVLFSWWTTRGCWTSLLASTMWPRPQQAWLSEHTPFVGSETSLLHPSDLLRCCYLISMQNNVVAQSCWALPPSPFQ